VISSSSGLLMPPWSAQMHFIGVGIEEEEARPSVISKARQ